MAELIPFDELSPAQVMKFIRQQHRAFGQLTDDLDTLIEAALFAGETVLHTEDADKVLDKALQTCMEGFIR